MNNLNAHDMALALAEEYSKSVGDDCLCQRNPGTSVGEHIYCFCGCQIYAAVIYGFDACEKIKDEEIQALRAEIAKLKSRYEVQYMGRP